MMGARGEYFRRNVGSHTETFDNTNFSTIHINFLRFASCSSVVKGNHSYLVPGHHFLIDPVLYSVFYSTGSSISRAGHGPGIPDIFYSIPSQKTRNSRTGSSIPGIPGITPVINFYLNDST